MLNSFLLENGNFKNYGPEHLVCFIACVVIIVLVLYLGKNKWNEQQQILYITILCALGAGFQLFKVFYKYDVGSFQMESDLPLHLCNLMILAMPFIMWFKDKIMWGITFFWIMAGCAQSLFTPTLTESMPHFEAIRYWSVHAFIILGALYGLIVYGYKLTIRDAIKSVIGLNILAALLYPINIALGSNYMYLNAKPAGTTFYDLLGPWPYYILVLEFIIVLIFSVILIPFYWSKLKLIWLQK